MLRKHLSERKAGETPDFRWRGGEITRVEGFSDAVFAFAVTLLVVSLEVPRTFDELLEAMRGFVAFAVCFLLLLLVWYWHYSFFRRYGLQDTFTIVMNGILLFVVLFYVYPLKFLFTLVIDQATGRGELVTLANGTTIPRIEEGQSPILLAIYGLGYLAIALIFAILHLHAYRQRAALGLTPLEALITTHSIQRFLLTGGIGLLSVLIALLGGPSASSLAGPTYMLLWPTLTIHGFWGGRQQRRFENPDPAEAP